MRLLSGNKHAAWTLDRIALGGQSSRARKLLVSSGVILGAALIAFFFWAKIEGGYSGPSYGGKTLRQWIRQMDSSSPAAQTQAVTAVRQIGTNALPKLIQWMAHRNTASERHFYQWLGSKPRLAWLWPTLMRNSENHCEYIALLGFYALGSEARPALPSLQRLVREDHPANPAKPLNAAQAYAYVAPVQAKELAREWLTSTNRELITAGTRLNDALVSVRSTIANP